MIFGGVAAHENRDVSRAARFQEWARPGRDVRFRAHPRFRLGWGVLRLRLIGWLRG